MTATDAPSPETLQKTPLHDAHVALGAQMVPFAGWRMPIRYASIIDEHHAVRNAAGLFDLGHMGRIRIAGRDRVAFLDGLVTNRVQDLPLGAARYALLTTETGGIVDDVIYYILDDEIFLVCNASNRVKVLAWLAEHRGGRAVSIVDRSAELAMVAIQGPRAVGILQRLTEGADLGAIGNYHLGSGKVAGCEARLARTGYTGEDGFEIYYDAARARTVWDALLAAGKAEALVPCGLGARDTLRTEAAMPLYGHEISLETNPIEAGLGFAVKADEKGDFLGRAPIMEALERGPRRKLVCFRVKGPRIVREGTAVLDAAGATVGRVTSGTMSPTLGHPIGMAYVPSELSKVGTSFRADIRGQAAEIEVVKRPFYKRAK